LAVVSSEQEARRVPVGSQATVFTSSVWPCSRGGRREGGREGGTLTRNVCEGSGAGWLRSRSLMVLSALPVAKEVSFRQARSRIGASWRFFHFCCVLGREGGTEGGKEGGREVG